MSGEERKRRARSVAWKSVRGSSVISYDSSVFLSISPYLRLNAVKHGSQIGKNCSHPHVNFSLPMEMDWNKLNSQVLAQDQPDLGFRIANFLFRDLLLYSLFHGIDFWPVLWMIYETDILNGGYSVQYQATVLARQSSYSHHTAMRILRTHISISLHSFNALSVNIRKRRPGPLGPIPILWIRIRLLYFQDRTGSIIRVYYPFE